MRIALVALVIAFCVSCTHKDKQTNEQVQGPGYFSVIDFAKDQFDTYWGQPFGIKKIITLNGKTDSSYFSVFQMEWGSILKAFFDSDIGNIKYVGQYNFSSFEDSTMDTKTYYYEAKDKKLFTRSLQIITNAENDKVKSIYIETKKNGRVQKLMYLPIKLIQIQEYESSFIGGKKDLHVEYRFL